MADSAPAPMPPSDTLRAEPEERETPKRALVHIGIGALALTLVTGIYVWQARRTHAAEVLMFEAKPLLKASDTASLKKAEELYRQVLDIQGSNEPAMAGLAETHTLLWVQHGIEDYKAKAQESVALADRKNAQRAERYAAQALLAYGEGHYDEAIAIINKVAAQGGVADRLSWVLGLAQRSSGQTKGGRENLRQAQAASPLSPHYAVDLGDAYDDDADERNSHVFWGQAAQTNANYVPAAARNLGANKRRESMKNVEAEFQKLDALPPESLGPADLAAIALGRADLYYFHGKTTEGLQQADKAAALLNNARTHHARARGLLSAEKHADGLAAMQRARDLAPGAVKYLYALADALAAAGKAPEAVALLEGAPEKATHTEDPVYLVQLGDAYRAKGDNGKAKATYEAALKVYENYPEALLGLGKLLWKQKNYDAATEMLEKAVAARSQFPEVYEAIGLMWLEQGAATQAVGQLEAAEKMYKARGADAVRIQTFYTGVLKSLNENGGSAHVAKWQAREKAFKSERGS